MSESVWLFGYGSLIYKVDFPYLECQPARVEHWVRRFWQGSHDHRGTPEKPGRVVTLFPMQGACCCGVAYRVKPETLKAIDIREKNGYLRQPLTLKLADGSCQQAIAYVADRRHPAFLGPASLDFIAHQIAASMGESGSNSEYLCRLAESLEALSAPDHHVLSLVKRLPLFDIN